MQQCSFSTAIVLAAAAQSYRQGWTVRVCMCVCCTLPKHLDFLISLDICLPKACCTEAIHKSLELFGEPTVVFISLILDIYWGELNSYTSEPVFFKATQPHAADILKMQPRRRDNSEQCVLNYDEKMFRGKICYRSPVEHSYSIVLQGKNVKIQNYLSTRMMVILRIPHQCFWPLEESLRVCLHVQISSSLNKCYTWEDILDNQGTPYLNVIN